MDVVILVEIESVVRKVNVINFIKFFFNGFDIIVGERGFMFLGIW